MSNVTQLTKVKTGLYALITFLFVAFSPAQAQQCNTYADLKAGLEAKYEDEVFIENDYTGQVAANIVAAFNAVPPESFIVADRVVVFAHKWLKDVVVVAFVKASCVEAFMVPQAELKKFLPNGA